MRTCICAVALLCLFAPLSASAAEGVDAPTVTGETGLFTLFSGGTLPQGEWSFGIYWNNWDRIVIPDAVVPLGPQFSSEWDYDWNRLSASVGYGLTDSFELSLMLPYEDFDASDNNRFGRINGRYFVNDIDASGVGDVRLGAKWKLYTSEDEHSKLALNAFVELDTGDDDEGVVTGNTGFGAGLAYQAGGWVFNVGYHDPGDPEHVDVPEEVLAGLGYAANVTDRLDWITELNATVYTGDDPTPDDAIDLATGGRLWFGETERWAFNFALRTNVEHLSDTDEFCPIGGLLGLTYFPRKPREFNLTVTKEGEGQGTVTSNPPGIDCGAACAALFEKGTVVALTAQPAEGSTFDGWSGDCVGGSVTLDQDRACTAEFGLVPPPPPPPPEEKPEPPPPPPPPPPVIEEVCLFAADSARVDNRCKATLDEVALRMKDEAERIAIVIGYTDATGSDASNQRMSLRRAEAVKAYLVTRHGLDEARITTEGRGSAEPVGDNATREGRAQNRRAVIILKVQ